VRKIRNGEVWSIMVGCSRVWNGIVGWGGVGCGRVRLGKEK